MAGYVVTAAAVRVVVGSTALMVERGHALPEGVSDEQIKHLVGKDLVAKSGSSDAKESVVVEAPEPLKAEATKPEPAKPGPAKPADSAKK